MSKQVKIFLNPGQFKSTPDMAELIRRLDEMERQLHTTLVELNKVLMQKPDRSELLPSVFTK